MRGDGRWYTVYVRVRRMFLDVLTFLCYSELRDRGHKMRFAGAFSLALGSFGWKKFKSSNQTRKVCLDSLQYFTEHPTPKAFGEDLSPGN